MTRSLAGTIGHSLAAPKHNPLKARRLGIDMQQEAVVFMRRDCHVCRAEGFTAHARVQLSHGDRSIIATLYHVVSEMLRPDEVGLSESAWQRLALKDGDEIAASRPRPLDSLSLVRGKVYGHRLEDKALATIISDITVGRYSDIHLSSFITACSARPLDREETIGLTRAMVEVGDRLKWDASPIVDKHCVGLFRIKLRHELVRSTSYTGKGVRQLSADFRFGDGLLKLLHLGTQAGYLVA